MKRYGLIGYPLTHSFSKNYFTEKFKSAGMADHKYELFPIRSISELPAILEQYPDLLGLNVTIPYKQLVLPFLNSRQHIPAPLNACNCIKITNGSLSGYNTDTMGFEQCIMPRLLPFHRKALILGNGGAAEAVKYVFSKNGIAYKLVSRVLREGSDLTYEQLTPTVMEEYLVIVNTTPLGMYPDVDACPAIPYDTLGSRHYLFDLTYNPAKTLFLAKGEERGATIQNGAQMLVIQADESWNIWQTSEL